MNEDLALFARSLAVGFAIVTPVGPITLLLLRRSLVDGWSRGAVSALGVAAADSVYAVLAASGVTAIATVLAQHATVLHWIAGGILTLLGLQIALKREGNGEPARASAGGSFATAFALTMTNPLTILGFAAALTVLAPARASWQTFGIEVAAMCLASLVWQQVIVAAGTPLRAVLTRRVRRWIDLVAGAVLVGFGVRTAVASR